MVNIFSDILLLNQQCNSIIILIISSFKAAPQNCAEQNQKRRRYLDQIDIASDESARMQDLVAWFDNCAGSACSNQQYRAGWLPTTINYPMLVPLRSVPDGSLAAATR